MPITVSWVAVIVDRRPSFVVNPLDFVTFITPSIVHLETPFEGWSDS